MRNAFKIGLFALPILAATSFAKESAAQTAVPALKTISWSAEIPAGKTRARIAFPAGSLCTTGTFMVTRLDAALETHLFPTFSGRWLARLHLGQPIPGGYKPFSIIAVAPDGSSAVTTQVPGGQMFNYVVEFVLPTAAPSNLGFGVNLTGYCASPAPSITASPTVTAS